MLPNRFIQTSNIKYSWKLLAIGITDDCKNKTQDKLEKAVWDRIVKRVEFNSKGRSEVSLPMSDNCQDLPSGIPRRGGSNPPKFRMPSKIMPNSTRL